jgi:hypothetical protein
LSQVCMARYDRHSPERWPAPAIVERSRRSAQDAASKKWPLFTLLSHRREPS